MAHPAPHRIPGLFLGLSLLACGDSGVDPPASTVDLDALFAAPTATEEAAVRADWATRQPMAAGVTVEATQAVDNGGTASTLQVVSHDVDGVQHFGAVLTPDGAAPGSLPILVYLHGGDDGVDVDELLPLLPLVFTDLEDAFVVLIPSFRAEPLVFDGVTYPSGGEASPWDRDVDDALALIEVALAGVAPAADPSRMGAVGFSRGAGVALLMGIRDARIDRVVEFFGPTDFLGPWVRAITEDALNGVVRDLPGVAVLDQRFVQPLERGEITLAEVRLELLRRSPARFAADLPAVQIHHGTEDQTVPVGEGERLIAALDAVGHPDVESFIYPGGTHNPLSLQGSLDRTRSFLLPLTSGG